MNEVARLPIAAAPSAEPDALPHNIEAEQQLLGAILTNNDVYDRISSLVKPEHFFDPVHQRIFHPAITCHICAANARREILGEADADLLDHAAFAGYGGALYAINQWFGHAKMRPVSNVFRHAVKGIADLLLCSFRRSGLTGNSSS